MLFTYLSLLNLCSSGFFSARGSQVEELSSESATALTAAVKNSGDPQALILLQYMRECGHCVNAAPKYLALSKKFPEFKFAAIDCSAMPNLFCQSGDFQLRAFPTIRLVSQGKIEELDRDRVFNDAPVQYLQEQLTPFGAAPRDDFTLVIVPMFFPPNARWEREPGSAQIRRADAAEAVRLVLRVQVPKTEELSEATVTGARNFLQIIANSFPLKTVRDDAARVISMIPASPVSRDAWNAILDSAASFASGAPTFQMCSGFNCGLWQLFHILSAAAGRNWPENPANSAGEILAFTRATVENFLDCDGCKNHFITEFDAAALNRPSLDTTDRSAVILWLWKFHNSVSARVADERGWALDTQWPRSCGGCDGEPAILAHYWDAGWLGVDDSTVAATEATTDSPADTTTEVVNHLQSNTYSDAPEVDINLLCGILGGIAALFILIGSFVFVVSRRMRKTQAMQLAGLVEESVLKSD